MKSLQITFLLLLILVSCKESIQKDAADSGTKDWRNLETISKVEKLELIESLKKEFEYLATYDSWKDDNLKNFHFLDLDYDGDLDLIFDGWSGAEPPCVRVYINAGNHYKKVLDEFQEVSILELGESGLVRLSIKDTGCCASYITFNMDFEVETSQDQMSFHLINRTARIHNTELPRKLKEPVRFEIENEVYYLRATPKIDTTNLWYEGREGEDNIIAELKKGDKGRAIGESTDTTGRVWWFVEIDPEFGPKKSQFYDLEQRPTKVTGWLSSRFVKEIK